MTWFFRFLASSVGKKLFMGLTGFFLLGFLGFHIFVNSFLLVSPAAYNQAAEGVESVYIIPVLSLGLMAIILIHSIEGLYLFAKNRAAKGREYKVGGWSGLKNAPIVYMSLTGLVILSFLILHILHFKYKAMLPGAVREGHDLYALVTGMFAFKFYSGFYIAALLLLGLHLVHGTQSFFRTYGIYSKKWAGAIRALGVVVAVGFAGGFAVFPVYFGFVAPRYSCERHADGTCSMKPAASCCASKGAACEMSKDCPMMKDEAVLKPGESCPSCASGKEGSCQPSCPVHGTNAVSKNSADCICGDKKHAVQP